MFLIYVSYVMAIFLTRRCVVRGLSVEFVGGDAAPRTPGVRVLAGILHVAMDITTDPVSYHGDKWFLGEMWAYGTPSFFYGIPLTNYLAWVILAIVVLGAYHRLEEAAERHGWLQQRRSGPLPPRFLLGPCCYFGVFAFIGSVSMWLAFTWQGPERKDFIILTGIGAVLVLAIGWPFLRRLSEGRRTGVLEDVTATGA